MVIPLLVFKGIAAATGMRHVGLSSMALDLEVVVTFGRLQQSSVMWLFHGF